MGRPSVEGGMLYAVGAVVLSTGSFEVLVLVAVVMDGGGSSLIDDSIGGGLYGLLLSLVLNSKVEGTDAYGFDNGLKSIVELDNDCVRLIVESTLDELCSAACHSADDAVVGEWGDGDGDDDDSKSFPEELCESASSGTHLIV